MDKFIPHKQGPPQKVYDSGQSNAKHFRTLDNLHQPVQRRRRLPSTALHVLNASFVSAASVLSEFARVANDSSGWHPSDNS